MDGASVNLVSKKVTEAFPLNKKLPLLQSFTVKKDSNSIKKECFVTFPNPSKFAMNTPTGVVLPTHLWIFGMR